MTVSALVEPAFFTHPEYGVTLGPEVGRLAELAGFAPDPEQQLALDAMFAMRPDNRVAAFEFAVVCSRQNLKTALFKQAALGWLFITEQRLIVWSAHEFRTSQEAFRDMEELIRGTPFLHRRVKQYYRGNGDEAIELLTGQRLIFKARTKGGGRGLSGDKVVLDEAMFLQPSHMGALLPTLSARPDPQVVYGSSAGLAESDVLRGLRDRGRAGDPSLAYIEWSDDLPGECGSEVCDHALAAQDCRLDDRGRWARSNPAMGRRITVDYIAAERRALPPVEFARERLGWWDEAETIGFDFANWTDLLDEQSKADSVTAFGIEVSLDRSGATIGVCGPASSGFHVEMVDKRRGTGWVVDRCVKLHESYPSAVFVVDGGGPAASLIGELETAGVTVLVASTQDVCRACAGFVDAVMEGTIRHGPQPDLDAAIAGAKKRPLGDGAFAFGRKVSTADIGPLVAVTLAYWAAVRGNNSTAINNVW